MKLNLRRFALFCNHRTAGRVHTGWTHACAPAESVTRARTYSSIPGTSPVNTVTFSGLNWPVIAAPAAGTAYGIVVEAFGAPVLWMSSTAAYATPERFPEADAVQAIGRHGTKVA